MRVLYLNSNDVLAGELLTSHQVGPVLAFDVKLLHSIPAVHVACIAASQARDASVDECSAGTVLNTMKHLTIHSEWSMNTIYRT